MLFAPTRTAAMVMPHQMGPAPPQFVLLHAALPPPPLLQPQPVPMVVALRSPSVHGDLPIEFSTIKYHLDRRPQVLDGDNSI
jgi:hypothetical protein